MEQIFVLRQFEVAFVPTSDLFCPNIALKRGKPKARKLEFIAAVTTYVKF